jgi:hypothetical protein
VEEPSVGPLRARIGRLAYRLPLRMRRWVLYTRFQHRPPRLRHPVTFTEKVQWRILNDRRELIGLVCDKLKSKAMAEVAGVRVPRTYWHGTDVRELADVALPEHWVLKPNHRSGLVHFGRGPPDTEMLRELTRDWLRERQFVEEGEWGYSQAAPALFVEETLGEPGHPPRDYRLYVFEGEPKLIAVETSRYTGTSRRCYTPDWEPLQARVEGIPFCEVEPRPGCLEEMLAAAGRLGAPFDFIRVDFYLVDGEVVFGEFAAYPGSGIRRLQPRDLDRLLGSYWHLPSIT